MNFVIFKNIDQFIKLVSFSQLAWFSLLKFDFFVMAKNFAKFDTSQEWKSVE